MTENISTAYLKVTEQRISFYVVTSTAVFYFTAESYDIVMGHTLSEINNKELESKGAA